ncbi:iron-sulfur protein required for NADH dehydrogenase, mitochondrial isoform X1 [Castanea sativa]|uniref:iron-sulfur protein required for NADH dehydrogenase, mitochondrial isoform X1 n=1 Tax=Castanea sativa TaxID=21020 RepID=UPI003F65298D
MKKGFLSSFTRVGGVRGYSSIKKVEGIKHAIAVASGKGGVGKSTTAVNLAVALATKCQLKVGLLDADVYGPNVPIMMKINSKPEVTEDKKMVPIENYGVKCMSMGLLVETDAAFVWRGPMIKLKRSWIAHIYIYTRGCKNLVGNALGKMVRDVTWGKLDILVVDMPPGTGDAQISISQLLHLSGALIVSTPQDVALMDARRGVKMFSKVQVPILGIVENMSCFTCPHCGEPSFIFGNGGTRKTASEMGLEFVGEIPLEVDIRKGGDDGVPIVVSAPDSLVSKAYGDLAQKVVNRLDELSKKHPPPEILL